GRKHREPAIAQQVCDRGPDLPQDDYPSMGGDACGAAPGLARCCHGRQRRNLTMAAKGGRTQAPGLRWRKFATGRTPAWFADREAVRAGFRPERIDLAYL